MSSVAGPIQGDRRPRGLEGTWGRNVDSPPCSPPLTGAQQKVIERLLEEMRDRLSSLKEEIDRTRSPIGTLVGELAASVESIRDCVRSPKVRPVGYVSPVRVAPALSAERVRVVPDSPDRKPVSGSRKNVECLIRNIE